MYMLFMSCSGIEVMSIRQCHGLPMVLDVTVASRQSTVTCIARQRRDKQLLA
jgi:hypothetical protein